MGRSSITDLQTSPPAHPHLSFCLFLSIRDAFHLLPQSTYNVPDSYYLRYYLFLRYVLPFVCVILCLSFPPSFSAFLLSIPFQSPAHVDVIPLSSRADCSETSCVV